MPEVPEKLRYSEDHEWVAYDAEAGVARMGITDYAQGELGDIVFLELPETGERLEAHAVCGTIEAVKAVAELFAPLSGEVVEVNSALEDHPEKVNQDPYGEGWMIDIRVADPSQLDGLLDADGYRRHIG